MASQCGHAVLCVMSESRVLCQKSELRSQSLKEIFSTIVTSLKDDNEKLLINSIGERDYETWHHLQLPMYRASREFTLLSLDGSRAMEERMQETTAPSALDH